MKISEAIKYLESTALQDADGCDGFGPAIDALIAHAKPKPSAVGWINAFSPETIAAIPTEAAAP